MYLIILILLRSKRDRIISGMFLVGGFHEEVPHSYPLPYRSGDYHCCCCTRSCCRRSDGGSCSGCPDFSRSSSNGGSGSASSVGHCNCLILYRWTCCSYRLD